MHKMILDATIAKVRQRASEGDCPITAAYSVEHLETALLTLADTQPDTAPVEASGSERETALSILQAAVRSFDSGDTTNLNGVLDDILDALRPQPSWSEEVQTADTTHSRRLFFGDPGSPQPSGETREVGHDSDCSVHNEPAYPNGPCDCEYAQRVHIKHLESLLGSINDGADQSEKYAALDWAITSLSVRPAPVASGGQHSSGDFTSVTGLWKDQGLSRFERVKAHRSEFGSKLKQAVEAVDEETARQTIASKATPARAALQQETQP